MVTARGMNGTIELHDDRIEITRPTGFKALIRGALGKSSKSIPLNQVYSMQFSANTARRVGFLRVVVRGERQVEEDLDYFRAARDANAVVFDDRQEAEFLVVRDKLRDIVLKRRARQR